jgi:(S)-3,5-dihydroxyphenylglycine transaminase
VVTVAGIEHADELAKSKSMITGNSAPLGQAVVAGRLLENGFRLADANRNLKDLYRRNLDLMLRGLRDRFPDAPDGGVRWTSPTGGFFLVVTVRFRVDDDLLLRSAREHGVLWTPTRHFYDGAGHGDHQLRLSVSSLTPQTSGPAWTGWPN